MTYNSGSVNGGQFLTITGSGFDATPDQTKVTIGNEECKIVDINNNELTCKTPTENGDAMTIYPGNAGLKYELWLNTGEVDLTTGWQIMDGTEPDNMTYITGASTIDGPVFNETNDYTARLYGFFVAPYDGKFQFFAASSDKHTLYFSNTSSPDDAMNIIECESPNDTEGCGSEDFELIGGEKYFIALIHHHRADNDPGNFLKIYFMAYKSSVTSEQTDWTTAERSYIGIGDNPVNEAQKIIINGSIPNDFYFTIHGINRLVPFDTSAPLDNWPESLNKMLNPMCTYDDGTDQNTIMYQGAETDEKLNAEQGILWSVIV